MAQEDNKLNNEQEKSKRNRIKADYKNRQYISHIFWRIKKIYPDIDQKKVNKIVSRYFELAREDLAHGNTVSLGANLGDLYLVKVKRKVYMNDQGVLVNNLPVDQGATNKLWKAKPELRGLKFVRHINAHSSGFLFKLKHYFFGSQVKNKSVYSFKFCRTLKSNLSENIINKEVEAYEIKTKDEQ